MSVVAKRLDGLRCHLIGMDVFLNFVLDGDPATPDKRANGWMHQDATLYGGRPQPRQLFGRWGPSPLPKNGRSPQFSAHVYCGQTAAWIKMLVQR